VAGSLTDEQFLTRMQIDQRNSGLKVDYARLLGSSVIVNVGGSWSSEVEATTQNLSVFRGAGPGPEARSALEAERNIGALYGTAQFPLGPWTVKPGLRVEANDFEVQVAGLAIRAEDVTLFPSLHVNRKLTEDVSMTVSYSRRTNRPDAQRLNPFIQFSSDNSAQSGNPVLKPEHTDAFEARFDYVRQPFTLGLTVYDRETRDAWSQTTRLLSDSIFLTSYLNTGERSERGTEVSLRGSIRTQWKYTSTVNLFYNRQEAFTNDELQTRIDFNYSLNATIDYKTNPTNGRLSNELQLLLRHFGPQVFYDNRTSSFTQVDMTWRHPFSETVSFVLTVNDVFNSAATRTRLMAGNLQEISDYRGAGTVVRAALTYRFK
jgi:outer membrane receptor protein involved in Fe transport